MDHRCESCSKTFSDQYVLARHVKTSKSCIKLRLSQKCDACDYRCETEESLLVHQNTCIMYLKLTQMKNELDHAKLTLKATRRKLEKSERRVVQRDKTILNLHKKITSILEIPKTKIDAQLQNLLPMTDQYLKDQQYSIREIDLEDGFGHYFETIFDGQIICIDKSRQKIVYRDENGMIVFDDKLTKLLPRFFKIHRDRMMGLITVANEEHFKSHTEDEDQFKYQALMNLVIDCHNCNYGVRPLRENILKNLSLKFHKSIHASTIKNFMTRESLENPNDLKYHNMYKQIQENKSIKKDIPEDTIYNNVGSLNANTYYPFGDAPEDRTVIIRPENAKIIPANSVGDNNSDVMSLFNRSDIKLEHKPIVVKSDEESLSSDSSSDEESLSSDSSYASDTESS